MTRALVLRAGVVAAVVLAFGAVELTSRSGVLWRFSTFTYQVNLFAAAFSFWTLCARRIDPGPALRGAAVLYVVVAGVVWNLFLTDTSMGYTPSNVLLHVVVPLLVLADWALVGRRQAHVRWWAPIAWLVYPSAYLGLALLVLNDAGRRPPYYFLDPDQVGAGVVGLAVVVLAAGFVGLGYGLAGLGRLAVAARPPTPTPGPWEELVEPAQEFR